MNNYFGFVYIWRDKKRNKYCVGSHYGKLDDGYTSSTGYFKAAYNKRQGDFKRRILYLLIIDDKKLLLSEEQKWLSMIKNDELGKRYYNFKKNANGGNGRANKGNKSLGGWNKDITSEMLKLREEKKFCLLIDKPKPKRFGPIIRSPETRQKMSNAKKEYWKQYKIKYGIPDKKSKIKKFKIKKPRIPWNKGKTLSKEHKEQIRQKMIGRKAWNKGKVNPTASYNGKKGAKKQSEKVTGRKIAVREDGTRYWVYPK